MREAFICSGWNWKNDNSETNSNFSSDDDVKVEFYLFDPKFGLDGLHVLVDL